VLRLCVAGTLELSGGLPEGTFSSTSSRLERVDGDFIMRNNAVETSLRVGPGKLRERDVRVYMDHLYFALARAVTCSHRRGDWAVLPVVLPWPILLAMSYHVI